MNIKRNMLIKSCKKINVNVLHFPLPLRRETTPPPLAPAHMCRGLIDIVREQTVSVQGQLPKVSGLSSNL